MLTTSDTAALIVNALKSRNEVQPITRIQLSAIALADLSERSMVDAHFINSLTSDLLSHGWCMFQITSTTYGLIEASSAGGFRKLSAASLLAKLD
jgi:hypothetical protein